MSLHRSPSPPACHSRHGRASIDTVDHRWVSGHHPAPGSTRVVDAVWWAAEVRRMERSGDEGPGPGPGPPGAAGRSVWSCETCSVTGTVLPLVLVRGRPGQLERPTGAVGSLRPAHGVLGRARRSQQRATPAYV